MSGAIFVPLEGLGAPDAASGHPLVCPLCHAQFERPCLLDCFHDFCAGCLRGRATDGRLACPLCQHQTVVKGPSGLPPVDRLLQFLVDSSGDGMEVVQCANCDLECGKQDAETTYFCNTCGQPLCARCRDETHRARMFARHDIVALGQRSRDVLQKCTLHAEPYIMFSTDKKSLLCIRCFRDMQGESRAHCVDLESAYVQGCERLEQAVLAVKALQTATREAIAQLQAMVEEVRRSAAEEEAAIHALFGSMQDRLAERKALLLQAVQRFTWSTVHPSSAWPIRLSSWTWAMLAASSGPNVLMGPSCPSPAGKMLGSLIQKPTLHRSISTKVLLAEGEDTPFVDHCRHYEDSYRRLQAQMQNLKDQVQELHRDLTKHHSLIKAEIMGDILHKSAQVDAQIALEYASLEGMRAVFQEIWEESYQRVANEQEIYEAQLRDLLQLKQENAYLTSITKQITPYVRSIAKVKERLEPRLQVPAGEQLDHLQNTHEEDVSAETQARNDPVSVAEKREKTSEPRGNSRTPNSLKEEPPMKNKDPHRPKPKNGGEGPTQRERPT
ncbi:RING finger protein 207 isoform X2 [Acinonyx jubatus]|uniref:RING finger protein 207 n=1 Tax=Acinonyx jubatus TaxID=32536 RepID=A0A6J1ZH56_ACIJB|nr:RING finger protein 207 isoform X2 [Acinonyx jubatus]